MIKLQLLGAAAGARLIGRSKPGNRHLAFPGGGPVDVRAYEAALALVGLPSDAAILEVPLRGGRWRIEGACHIALTGADFGWVIDGRDVALHQSIAVESPVEIIGGFATTGQYGYVAVSGQVIRSSGQRRWSDLTGNQLIEPGRILQFEPLAAIKSELVPPSSRSYQPNGLNYLELTVAPETNLLSIHQRENLVGTSFLVEPRSNRQGIRLAPLPRWPENHFKFTSLLSSPVIPGTVQLTPSGLIILGPDAHTVGGYPRIGVIDEDQLARLYQERFGKQMGIAFGPTP